MEEVMCRSWSLFTKKIWFIQFAGHSCNLCIKYYPNGYAEGREIPHFRFDKRLDNDANIQEAIDFIETHLNRQV